MPNGQPMLIIHKAFIFFIAGRLRKSDKVNVLFIRNRLFWIPAGRVSIFIDFLLNSSYRLFITDCLFWRLGWLELFALLLLLLSGAVALAVAVAVAATFRIKSYQAL